MNDTTAGRRGTISQYGSILRIENALVEDVFTSNSRTGHVLVSYAAPGRNEMINIELLQLNVDWATILVNQFGDSISLCTVRRGMWVDADFSAAMTRSIPPQTNAFRIVAFLQMPAYRVTTDRIVSVDVVNGFLNTGNPDDGTDQMRFVVSRATEILDRNNNPIRFSSLQPGQLVRVEHANFQTASIPPQSTAYRIQLV